MFISLHCGTALARVLELNPEDCTAYESRQERWPYMPIDGFVLYNIFFLLIQSPNGCCVLAEIFFFCFNRQTERAEIQSLCDVPFSGDCIPHLKTAYSLAIYNTRAMLHTKLQQTMPIIAPKRGIGPCLPFFHAFFFISFYTSFITSCYVLEN